MVCCATAAGWGTMADDRDARITQLEAELRELRQVRDLHEAARAENAALTDILHRIVAAPGDTDGVLAVIAEHATRIGRASTAEILRCEGSQVWVATHYGPLLTPNTLRAAWSLQGSGQQRGHSARPHHPLSRCRSRNPRRGIQPRMRMPGKLASTCTGPGLACRYALALR